MHNQEKPLFPIKQSDLEGFKEEVTQYFKSVEWNPPQKAQNKDIDISFLLRSQSLNQSSDSLSLLKKCRTNQ